MCCHMDQSFTLYLANLPSWQSVLFVVVIPTVIASFGVFMVRKAFGYDKLINNNEVAGFIFAIVGLFYALLLTFATISAWDKFSEAQVAVVEEAGAASAIYRLSAGADASALLVHDQMNKYLTLAIQKDWPSMAFGKMDKDVTTALNELNSAAFEYSNSTKRSPSITIELIRQLDSIIKSRRIRLHLSSGVIPSMMWWVLFLGGIFSITYTYLFCTKNLWSQALMVAILAVLIFMNIFLIIQFNYPFTGDIYVSYTPLEETIKMFNK